MQKTKHKCILDACRYLEAKAFRITYLPVDTKGLIDIKTFEGVPNTKSEKFLYCSIMTVNNEIDVKTIGQM
jgi:cysteine desulfurase